MRKKLLILMIFAFGLGIFTNQLPKASTPRTVQATAAPVSLSSDGGTGETIMDMLQKDGRRFVAHRGFCDKAPENSLPAFELAARSGFWGIETDIFESKDGEFYCIHDDTLDRTTNGTGKVTELNSDYIASVKIDSGKEVGKYNELDVPTFSEYLDVCKELSVVPVIELKTINHYEALVNKIREKGLLNKCIIIGAEESLSKIRDYTKDPLLMVIGYYNNQNYQQDNRTYIELMERYTDNKGILFNYPSVTKELVDEMHAKNMVCGVWNIDNINNVETYFSYGVDFIESNTIPSLDIMVNMGEY